MILIVLMDSLNRCGWGIDGEIMRCNASINVVVLLLGVVLLLLSIEEIMMSSGHHKVGRGLIISSWKWTKMALIPKGMLDV